MTVYAFIALHEPICFQDFQALCSRCRLPAALRTPPTKTILDFQSMSQQTQINDFVYVQGRISKALSLLCCMPAALRNPKNKQHIWKYMDFQSFNANTSIICVGFAEPVIPEHCMPL